MPPPTGQELWEQANETLLEKLWSAALQRNHGAPSKDAVTCFNRSKGQWWGRAPQKSHYLEMAAKLQDPQTPQPMRAEKVKRAHGGGGCSLAKAPKRTSSIAEMLASPGRGSASASLPGWAENLTSSDVLDVEDMCGTAVKARTMSRWDPELQQGRIS
jgi:hypothetical protein